MEVISQPISCRSQEIGFSASESPVYTKDIRRAAFNLAVVIMIAKSAPYVVWW